MYQHVLISHLHPVDTPRAIACLRQSPNLKGLRDQNPSALKSFTNIRHMLHLCKYVLNLNSKSQCNKLTKAFSLGTSVTLYLIKKNL